MAFKEDSQIKDLKKRIARYEEILDMITEGVFVTDPDGKIVFINKFSCVLENMDRDSVIGKNEYEIAGGREAYSLDHKQIDMFPKDGSRYFYNSGKAPLMTNCYPFYFDGKLENYYSLGFFLDYTKVQLTKILEFQQKLLNSTGKSNNETTFTLDDFIGTSPEVKKMLDIARLVAMKDSNVMIYGETGTGKEIIAQGIHNGSPHREGKFVAVNCAAIPENLMESILFGSTKGAFTGAADKKGLIEEAANGTLFLDEINSMPYSIQGKMLRVLQEKTFQRVGGKTTIKATCRFLSACNQDPWELMREGSLREDLFFRLSTVILFIPPLSERMEDLEPLIQGFIEKGNRRYRTSVTGLDPACLTLLEQYSWPGNVRELEHLIEYMMNMNNGDPVLKVKDLPPYFVQSTKSQQRNHGEISAEGTLKQRMERFEAEIIGSTLEKNGFNISKTARELGIRRETLHYRIKKLEIKTKHPLQNE